MLLFVLVVLVMVNLQAQNSGDKAQLDKSVTAQYNALENQIKYAFNYTENFDQLDSVCHYLIKWSEDKPTEIRLRAIYNYFERSNYQPPQSIELGELALKLSSDKNVSKIHAVVSRIYMSRVCLAQQNTDEANELLDEALASAADIENKFYVGYCLLELGDLYSAKDQNKMAIRLYLDAMNLAEDRKDDSLYYLCCDYLSEFFFNNRINTKAINYSQLILDHAIEKKDSNTIIWTLLDIQNYKGHGNIGMVNQKMMDDIISYADRTNNQKLSRYTFATYRTILTNQNKFKDLAELCMVKYPERFERLGKSEYHLYCRIKALIFESQGQLDSAFYYFDLAKTEIENETNAYMIAHFNQRYGEFLLRNKKNNQAIIYFKKSLSYFSSTGFELRSEQVSESLELAYKELNNYKEAYRFAMLSKEYYAAYLNQLESEELLNAEHDHEIENRKEESTLAEAQRKIESKNERRKRTILSYGLALFLLLSGISYYQFRLTRKERNKSNDLLLNILPKSTAEELKTKGKTTAKRFENATVLFSDIKGFTQIAEELSPEDLVKELDIYFTRFDEIAKTYGLEKIKTIGDAYLAVGGLPEGNTATAKDVIKCAIEIMDFTKKNKFIKEKQGLPFFEIRIGINTGNVVAGVVGKNKFQYDIWGDAVNTAARMEQSGEVGKINISHATFLQVSDQYKCHFRGKVKAKNKGEIEMYFVGED